MGLVLVCVCESECERVCAHVHGPMCLCACAHKGSPIETLASLKGVSRRGGFAARQSRNPVLIRCGDTLSLQVPSIEQIGGVCKGQPWLPSTVPATGQS